MRPSNERGFSSVLIDETDDAQLSPQQKELNRRYTDSLLLCLKRYTRTREDHDTIKSSNKFVEMEQGCQEETDTRDETIRMLCEEVLQLEGHCQEENDRKDETIRKLSGRVMKLEQHYQEENDRKDRTIRKLSEQLECCYQEQTRMKTDFQTIQDASECCQKQMSRLETDVRANQAAIQKLSKKLLELEQRYQEWISKLERDLLESQADAQRYRVEEAENAISVEDKRMRMLMMTNLLSSFSQKQAGPCVPQTQTYEGSQQTKRDRVGPMRVYTDGEQTGSELLVKKENTNPQDVERDGNDTGSRKMDDAVQSSQSKSERKQEFVKKHRQYDSVEKKPESGIGSSS